MLRKCLFKTSNRIDLLMPDLKNDFKPPTRLKIPAKIAKDIKNRQSGEIFSKYGSHYLLPNIFSPNYNLLPAAHTF